jgi:hypothetical protein
MDITPIAGLWGTPVAGNHEWPGTRVAQKCATRVLSYVPLAGKEFSTPLEPTAVHWNESCTRYKALPEQDVVLELTNVEPVPCLVRVVWQNGSDVEQSKPSEIVKIASGETLTFDPKDVLPERAFWNPDPPVKPNDARKFKEAKPSISARVYVQPVPELENPIVSSIRGTLASCFGLPVPPQNAKKPESYLLEVSISFDSGARITLNADQFVPYGQTFCANWSRNVDPPV